MGRRIEVELTSARDDGTWTWRAAGARQPKGVLDAGLLYEGARVGDVVRAEADFEIEGILITAVLPPKEKRRSEPDRLEVIGPAREHAGGVTSSLVPKSERPRPERGRDRDERRPRPGTDGERRAGGRGRDERAGGPDRRPQGRAGGNGRSDGRPRPEERRARAPRDGGERAPREAAARPAAPAPEPATPKPKRLAPANVHRAAVVASLPPEQHPVAEQVLRGGIPAVRQAIDAQNAQLRAEGRPEVHAGPLLAMAEQLLPQLKAAEWRDRAEAAAKLLDEVSLRDLRSVVAGADAARDDESRLLAGTLRQALERRLAEQRERWIADVTAALDEGRLVRALRLSARPPDTASRFPAELALRLSEAAGAAMSPDATPDRWGTLLEAVADSPVRRSVKPAGLPGEPGEALLQAAHQAAGRVPALAALLGIAMPPPPGPPRPGRHAPRPGARAPRSPGGGRRPPAPPTAPEAAAGLAAAPLPSQPGGAPPRPQPDPAPAPGSPEPPGAHLAPDPAPAAPEPVRPEPAGPGDAEPLGTDPVPVAADGPGGAPSEVDGP